MLNKNKKVSGVKSDEDFVVCSDKLLNIICL